jgi:hypothetical protein
LIVYFDSSIVEILVNNADPSFSSVRTVEPRIGCVSRDTIVSLGKEQYFLDQYGQYRSLIQTINASQQGVRAEPLSESIVFDIPKRIHLRYAFKATAELLDDRLYLFLPMDDSKENNECWVFDTVRKSWMGPWELAHTISATSVSNTRNKGYDLYGANGNTASPVAKVYRFFAGTFLDDGEDILYSEVTRQFDMGIPHKDKTPTYAELEVEGSIGASGSLQMRTNDNDDFLEIDTATVTANADTDFPIAELGETGTVFPIAELGETGTVFPLTESVPQVITEGTPIHSETVQRGRFIQMRIQSTPSGKQFRRKAFRFGVSADQHDTTGIVS